MVDLVNNTGVTNFTVKYYTKNGTIVTEVKISVTLVLKNTFWIAQHPNDHKQIRP